MAEDVKRKISIFINDREIKDSLGAIGREIGKIKRELKETTNPEDRARLNKELANTKKRYSEIKEEIDDTNVSLDEARGHFSNLVSGLVSGDIQLVQSGLQGIVGNLKGMTKAALAFIATPIGLAITALAGIGLATTKWVEANNEILKTKNLLRGLTGLAGEAVEEVRVRAEALQKKFDVDLIDSVNTAKSLVKNMEISYSAAYDIIENGAIRGKTLNEDYLNSLSEYAVQFKNAGFSAKEFANVVETGIDLAIYTDKLPDAVKEAGLELKEGSDGLKESLTDAFGDEFTERIINNVKTGETTVKDALLEIADASEKYNLNEQQRQEITSKLFISAGEDAGGAIKIFEALNIALNEQKKPLTELQQLSKRALEQEQQLAKATATFFGLGNENIEKLISKTKIFANDILLRLLGSNLGSVTDKLKEQRIETNVLVNSITNLGVESKARNKLIDELQEKYPSFLKNLDTENVTNEQLKNRLKEVNIEYKERIKLAAVNEVISEKMTEATELFKNELQLQKDIEKIKLSNDKLAGKTDAEILAYYESNKRQADRNNSLTGLSQAAIKIKELSENRKEQLLIEKEILEVQERAGQIIPSSNFTEPTTNTTATNGNTTTVNTNNVELTEEDKKIKASKEKLAEFLKDFEEDQALQRELNKLAEEERAEAAEVLKLEAKYKKMAEDAGYETVLEAGLLEAKNIELQEIKDKYDALELEKKAEKDAELLKLDEKQKAALIKAETDLEAAKAELQSSGFSLALGFFDKKSALYKVLFGLEKAIAINQVIVDSSKALAAIAANTGIANAKAIAASPLTGGLPFTAVNSAIGAKEALTTKIMAGVQIANIAATALQGFYDGGNTGNKAIAYDSYGKITGVVHDDEWVMPKIMTQNPKYAANLAYLESERKSLVKGYYNGGATSTTNSTAATAITTASENTTVNQTGLTEIMQKTNTLLDFLITNGITAVLSSDLKNAKRMQEMLDDYQTLRNKNTK